MIHSNAPSHTTSQVPHVGLQVTTHRLCDVEECKRSKANSTDSGHVQSILMISCFDVSQNLTHKARLLLQHICIELVNYITEETVHYQVGKHKRIREYIDTGQKYRRRFGGVLKICIIISPHESVRTMILRDPGTQETPLNAAERLARATFEITERLEWSDVGTINRDIV
jgi:hypothetical protein